MGLDATGCGATRRGGQPPSLGPRYVVTWTESNGTDETTGPISPGSQTRNWNTSVTGSPYSSGSSSGGNFGGADTWGTCKTSGTMKATFTWDDDGTGLPPPQVVVVKEVASASRSGVSGAVDCGLSPATEMTDDNFLMKSATKYSVIQNPGASFTKQITVSAEGVLPENSGQPLLAATANASYEVTIYPVRILLQGVKNQYSSPKALIGQKIVATLETDLPMDGGESFAWNASGTKKFKSNSMSFTSSSLNTNINYSLQQLSLAYASPQLATLSISFQPDLWGLAAIPLSVEVTIDPPTDVEMSVSKGTVQVLNFSGAYYLICYGISATIPDFEQYYKAHGEVAPVGIYWSCNTKTPASFLEPGNGGRIFYVNTMKQVSRTWVQNGIPSGFSGNFSGSRKIDTSYPYKIETYTGYFDAGLTMTKLETDTPWVRIFAGYSSVSMDDVHETFLMYEPPQNGVAAYAVPLDAYEWHPEATATSSPSWHISSGGSISGTARDSYPDFPIWSGSVGG